MRAMSLITCHLSAKIGNPPSDNQPEHNTDLCRVTSSWIFLGWGTMLMFESQLAFQPEEQLPLHMACSRPSGAVEIVKTLLKASGKDAKLTSDKVSKKKLTHSCKQVSYFENLCWRTGKLSLFNWELERKPTNAPKTVTLEVDLKLPSKVNDENRWLDYYSETGIILQRVLVPLHTSRQF